MAELKTKETKSSVTDFIGKIEDETRRKDCLTLVKIMKAATNEKPHMWGSSIVGFGSYHYKYASGHEGDTCVIGFSPRKDSLSLYLMGGLDPLKDLLAKLGKHKTGKGCLYIKKLEDVDRSVLKQIIDRSVASLAKKKASA